MEDLQNLIKFLKDKGLEHQKINVDVLCGIIEYFAKKQETKQCNIADVSNCALFENDKLVSNMCISFRHDFGLLPKLIQEDLKRDCKEWLRAYENNKEHCC
jgi:hypothetical protein